MPPRARPEMPNAEDFGKGLRRMLSEAMKAVVHLWKSTLANCLGE